MCNIAKAISHATNGAITFGHQGDTPPPPPAVDPGTLKTPVTVTPPTPPPAPTSPVSPNNQQVPDAAAEEARRQARRRGRASTILTGGLGDPSFGANINPATLHNPTLLGA